MVTKKQSKNQSDMTTRDEEERQLQHENDAHMPMKVSSSIPTTPGCTKSDQSQDRHEESSSGVKIVDGKDVGCKEIPAVRQTGVRSEIVIYRKSPIDLWK